MAPFAFLKARNNAETTLAEAITAVTTEIKPTSIALFPASYPFAVTLSDTNEIVQVEAAGEKPGFWKVVRGSQAALGGPAAAAHPAGTKIELRPTAKEIEDLNAQVNAAESALPPTGGTENQALVKKSGANFDTTWKGPVVFSNGLAGGQTIQGDTAANGNLVLESTANATKGFIAFATVASAEPKLTSTTNAVKGKLLFGTSAYVESTNFLGIGTKTPTAYLQVEGPKAEPFQAAPPIVKVTGAEGGEAVGEEVGGEGSAVTVTGGKGGPSTVVGSNTIAGGGGGGLFSGGAGGIANGANTQENKGGKGAGFFFVGGEGGAALNSTLKNLAGEGGNVSFAGGKGGSAGGTTGTREGAKGGSIIFEAGAGGTGTAHGGGGGGILMEAGKNNEKPGPSDGLIQLKAGAGAASIAGGNIELLTYKESVVVGAQIIVSANGELIFKNESTKTRLQITATGNIGLYGATPVPQAPEIKTMAATGTATVKELEEKINQLVKALAANAGGIGIAK